MPLDSPEAYKRLGLHLTETDAIIGEFCVETGFQVQSDGISRYPMRRIILSRSVQWWVELRMDDDEDGNRFDHFFPEIPYSLFAGAWLDRGVYRYCAPRVDVFWRLPFRLVVPQLAIRLREAWKSVQNITPDDLTSLGPKAILGQGSIKSDLL